MVPCVSSNPEGSRSGSGSGASRDGLHGMMETLLTPAHELKTTAPRWSLEVGDVAMATAPVGSGKMTVAATELTSNYPDKDTYIYIYMYVYIYICGAVSPCR